MTQTTKTIRSTRQRRAVAEILHDFDSFASAQEIHERLKQRGESIGLATVYRNLQTLADAAVIDVLRKNDGEALYRQCNTGHHHHLVCVQCGYAVEVEEPSVEKWASRVGRKHGFTQVEHTVEIFGLCADCSRSAPARHSD